jgi:CDP-diacylglycerol--glycerol-3-phosphate 3-phosphatidyltransferase
VIKSEFSEASNNKKLGKKLLNIPNILTLLRLALVPVFILVFLLDFKHHHLISALIFLVAAVTDWLDGFLARKLNQTSPFGAFLDPVVDKVMVAAALVLLVSEFHSFWMSIAGIVIVSREIVVSALREWMAELGERATVKVSFIGKVKTAMQMISLIILLASPALDTAGVALGILLIYVSVILTLWSMFIYLIAAWKHF